MRKLLLSLALAFSFIAPAFSAVLPSFWGVTVEVPGTTPWPSFFVGTVRQWGVYLSTTEVGYWSNIQLTCNGNNADYSWTLVDQMLTTFEAQNVDIEWTILGSTPGCTNGSAGRAVPPTQASEVTRYVTALTAHLAARPNNRVKYFSIANEVDATNASTGFCTAACQALLPTYTANIVPVIRATLPNALILTPSLSNASNLTGIAVLDAYLAATSASLLDIVNSHGYAVWTPNNAFPEQFWNIDNIYKALWNNYSLGSAQFWYDEGGYKTTTVTAANQPFWTSEYQIFRASDGISRAIWYSLDPTPDPVWGALYDATGLINLNPSGLAYRVTQSALAGATFSSPLARVAGSNGITNVNLTGFSAGSPGTLPTTWQVQNCDTSNGLTQTLGTGTDGGVTYISLRYQGTLTGSPSGFCRIFPETQTQIAQATSTISYWSHCAYVGITATTASAATAFYRLSENNAGGTSLSLQAFQIPLINYSLANQNMCFPWFTSGNASTNWVAPFFQVSYSSVAGTAIDFTIKIGQAPQMDTSGRWSATITKAGGRQSEITWNANGVSGGTSYTVPGTYSFARDLTTGALIDISSGSVNLTNTPVELSNQAFSGFVW